MSSLDESFFFNGQYRPVDTPLPKCLVLLIQAFPKDKIVLFPRKIYYIGYALARQVIMNYN